MQPPPSDDALEQPPPNSRYARVVLKALSVTPEAIKLTCPLCGTPVSARGLRARPLRGVDAKLWQLIFTCPACGLISAFDVNRVTPELVDTLKRNRTDAWLEELQHFGEVPRSDTLNYTREVGPRQFIGTFAVTFITWLCLIGNFNLPEVVWGLAVSLIIARLTYRFAAIDLPSWALQPRRWRALAALVVEFVRQLVVQNLTLSIRVLRPGLPIRPGIVAIPTKLTGDVPLTILGSLTTLTPDTVTMDIDTQRGLIYVHWIDVKTQDADEMYKLISASLEEKIMRWLL